MDLGLRSSSNQFRWLVITAIYLSSMQAYTLIGIPVPYLALPCLFLACLLIRGEVINARALQLLTLTTLGLTIVSATANLLGSEQAWFMPPGATTPYPIFVSLRYLELIAFTCCVIVSYHFWHIVGADRAIKVIATCGTVIAAYAIYVWVAEQIGLPELPRTRLGTGGQDFLRDTVQFQYSFHRALGSFREPSHLAGWLVFPLFAQFARDDRVGRVQALASLCVFALTGSLLGLVMIGVALSMLLMLSWTTLRGRLAVKLFGLVMAIAVVILAVEEIELGVVEILSTRLGDLIEGGIATSNRSDVFDYYMSVPFLPFGIGLGNASLQLTSWLGFDYVASHLSLYVHYLYASGLLGLVLVSLIMFIPFFVFKRSRTRPTIFASVLLATHASWVISYLGNAESLQIIHAFVYGFLLAALGKVRGRVYVEVSQLKSGND